ncbi:MAG: SPFH domain-containing protein [Desulfobacula sp.]|nr:SPFH domain-containing protein [Desulfobacula sp.]
MRYVQVVENIKKAKELDIAGQIEQIVAYIGKIKIAALLVLLLFSFLFMAVFVGIGSAIIGELIIIVILIILVAPFISLKKIPNMYVGVPLILGERNDGFILKEGWAIVINGIFEHIPVNVKKINLDFSVTVHTIDRFQVILPVSIMIRVDKNRVCEFLDASGRPEGEKEGNKGVADIIVDMAKSSITTSSKTKTLDDILEIHPEITLNALKAITDQKSIKNNETIKSDQPLTVPGLGITLTKLIIKEPKPTGKAVEVYEIKAVEEFTRKFELYKTETKLIKLMQIQKKMNELKESGQIIDANSMYLILTEQELLEKGYKITPGLNTLLISLSKLIDKGAGISEILGFIKDFKGGKE